MWKRELKQEAENFCGSVAVKEYRLRFHFGHSYRTSKMNVVQLCAKYTTKNEYSMDHRLQKNILKACGSPKAGAAPTPINSTMNHIVNQNSFLKLQMFKNSLFCPKI